MEIGRPIEYNPCGAADTREEEGHGTLTEHGMLGTWNVHQVRKTARQDCQTDTDGRYNGQDCQTGTDSRPARIVIFILRVVLLESRERHIECAARVFLSIQLYDVA